MANVNWEDVKEYLSNLSIKELSDKVKELEDLWGVEAAVGPRSGFGRVDHHVAAGQQLVQSFAIVVAAQVERHPPFAEVAQLEEEGAIIDQRRQRAGR